MTDANLPDEWRVAEAVLEASRIVLLHGKPGTGKTRAALTVGEPKSVYNVYLTEETPAAELRGHYVPMEGQFIWKDGPVVAAMRQGKRLVLNEIDHASGDALSFLLGALDDPAVAQITLPTGETVKPKAGYQVVATMNGQPSDLPVALRDRFAVSVEIREAHPDAVAALPEDLQAAATTIKSDDIERAVSVRSLNSFAELRPALGEEDAALAVFGDRAQVLLDAVRLGRAA